MCYFYGILMTLTVKNECIHFGSIDLFVTFNDGKKIKFIHSHLMYNTMDFANSIWLIVKIKASLLDQWRSCRNFDRSRSPFDDGSED